MSTSEESAGPTRRLRAVLREGETVTPLELFFDLVFVLALTQCTALMADEVTTNPPGWIGVGKAMLVLAVLWWAWVGYSWLTSVVDPEAGAVRIVMFVAMAAFLICALALPQAFGKYGLLFACAYGIVRAAHIGLFLLASTEDANLRRSTWTLAASTAVGVGLLVSASFTDGALQGGLWGLALLLDMIGPSFFGREGWRLQARHFAERHGLIIIIALGESIVAIGVGAQIGLDAPAIIAACLGIVVATMLWWAYFDVVALVAARRLENAEPGLEQNDIARVSFSYLHLPMVAGIVLIALGLKMTLAHVDLPLERVPTTALLGGTALYLFAHVAFRWRNVHRFSVHRLVVGLVLVALIPVLEGIPALESLAILAAILVGLIVYELIRFSELRARLRAELRHGVTD